MALQHQESGQTTNLTASEAEPTPTRQSNYNLLNLGVFEDDTCLLQEEFRRFLEKSGFVEEVIDFYINTERQLTDNALATHSTHDSDRLNTGEWEQLVRTRLPDWLFWLTYILTAQARLAEEKREMSRARLATALNDGLFRQTKDDFLFRAKRKKLWTPALLRNIVHEGLKDISLPGRVTLENVASPIKLVTPLSGKHLQKLLRQNDIKWIEIKRRYVASLLRLRRASW